MFNLVHYVTEESTEDRKCEARTVGLLSSRREVHFYLSRNKDKSETRTNDIRDRSFQPKRSARQVCAFVSQTPSQGCTMHETSERTVEVPSFRASRSLPSWMVIFTFLLLSAFYYQRMWSEKSKLHNYKKILKYR